MDTKRTFLMLIILTIISTWTFAHPGGTDSSGCHTCRTNCEEKWGIPYGFYHRHNPVRPCSEEEKDDAPLVKERKPSPPNLPPTPTPITPVPIPSHPLPIVVPPTEPIRQEPRANISTSLHKVVAVTDGDTIKVEINGTIERVRLLGIDSPETYNKNQCFGYESTIMMNKLVKGKYVRLERDTIQPNRDRFGRLLRYVYLEDGTLINEEMVKQGYAVAYTKYNSNKLEEFVELEKNAKSERLGLWGYCDIYSEFYIPFQEIGNFFRGILLSINSTQIN